MYGAPIREPIFPPKNPGQPPIVAHPMYGAPIRDPIFPPKNPGQPPIVAHPMYGAPIRNPVTQPPWMQDFAKVISQLQSLIDQLLGRR
jgi:hypothetical protein